MTIQTLLSLLLVAWVGAATGSTWSVLATPIVLSGLETLLAAAVTTTVVRLVVHGRSARAGPPAVVVRQASAPVTAPAVTAPPVEPAAHMTSGSRNHGRFGVALVAVLLTAAVGAGVRTVSITRGPLADHTAPGARSVELVVTVVGDVGVGADGGRWLAARVHRLPGWSGARSRERLLLRLPATSDSAARSPAVEGSTTVEVGARLAVDGVARRVAGQAAAGLRRLGIVVAVDVDHLVGVRAPPSWHRAANHLRARVREAAHRRLDPDEASLLTGLVTGDLTGQPDVVAEDVQVAGLSHLVAVSGSNVALVVAVVLWLVGRVVGRRRAAWWVSLAAVGWFVVLVRAEPSVVRAAVMATLVLSAMLVGRLRSTPHLLCTAGLVALLVDPMLATRLGFILSMAATAGVVVGMAWIDTLLAGRLPLLPAGPRRILAATCGAQVAVAPVLLLAGGDVHVASLPANLVAVPAAALASAVGGSMAAVALVAPDLAGLLAVAARPALRTVLGSARVFAGAEGQRATVIVLAVIAVVIAVHVIARWLRTAHGPMPAGRGAALPTVAGLTVVVLAGVVGLGPRPGGSGSPPAPVLVALDVGQGDALLLGDPSAGWMLVDGGPDPAVLLAGLRRHGVRDLAGVVLTHAHDDHTAGIAGILGRVGVGTVVVGPLADTDLMAAAAPSDTPVVTVAAGSGWRHGSMGITVLSPPPTGLGHDVNENSLVLRIDVDGGRSVLLTGDAEVIAQTLLLDDPMIDVDVLKVPHHGGATNASGFLTSTTPQMAIISAGRGNPFGHPHPDVLADLAGVEVRRTDHSGDVVVALD